MKNNPQAFPVIGDISQIHDGGMTLLDYFAGQVITGIVTQEEYEYLSDYASDRAKVSKIAYNIARAMLKERERHEQKTNDK